MPLELSNIQMRVERSIYEAIRVQLVAQGYLPDKSNTGRYPQTPAGQANYDADLTAIVTAEKFAIEVFGDSSSLQKGMQRTPRIGIIPRRIMPGDIGKDMRGGYSPNPLDPDNTVYIDPTFQSANLHIDINVVPANADQDRIIHSIIASAIGQLKYLPFYDDPTQFFLIRQFNFYDLPDNKNGIAEKSYSYEIPDLYLYDGEVTPVPLINEITVNLDVLSNGGVLTADGNVIGPYVKGDQIFINLSGIFYTPQWYEDDW